MKTREEREQGSAHHYVMEVRDHEVSCSQVNVDGNNREEYTGQTTDGEHPDESECIHQRRIETK